MELISVLAQVTIAYSGCVGWLAHPLCWTRSLSTWIDFSATTVVLTADRRAVDPTIMPDRRMIPGDRRSPRVRDGHLDVGALGDVERLDIGGLPIVWWSGIDDRDDTGAPRPLPPRAPGQIPNSTAPQSAQCR